MAEMGKLPRELRVPGAGYIPHREQKVQARFYKPGFPTIYK